MANHTCALDGNAAHRRARIGDGYWCQSCYEWSRRHDWADPSTRKRTAAAQPGRGCSVPDCPHGHKALGYCEEHYALSRRHGDATTRVRRPYGTVIEQLHAAATATTDECIYFGRQKERPRVTLDGKQMNASRAVWIIAKGDPGQAEVRHTCNGGSGATGCINIRHLRLGDHAANMRDMADAGHSLLNRTDTRGEDNGRAVLTEGDVREIRREAAQGTTRAVLAERFGVSPATIKDVVARRRWRHVE